MIKIEPIDTVPIERPFPPPLELRRSGGGQSGKLVGWICPLCHDNITYLETGHLWWKKKIPQECEHIGISEDDYGIHYRIKNYELNALLEEASGLRSFGTRPSVIRPSGIRF